MKELLNHPTNSPNNKHSSPPTTTLDRLRERWETKDNCVPEVVFFETSRFKTNFKFQHNNYRIYQNI